MVLLKNTIFISGCTKIFMYKLLLMLLIVIILLWSVGKDEHFKIYFLDVGQGDAILIRSPQGQNILIDGGPDNKLLYELSQSLPWWERQIDYVIVSHYHDDHLTGLIEVLNKYQVNNVLVTAHQPDDFLYQVWQDKLADKNIEPTIVSAGDSFVTSNGFSWQVILADAEHEDYNENSLVIKLSYKNNDFLLMGDLGIEGEERILASGLDINAEYLKVGHHGSKYSSSQEFLELVSPEVCIIQSGKENKFGHPHRETLDRLEATGCQILNTQDLGTIGFTF